MHSCSFALFYCLWFDLNLSLWGLKFKSNLLNLFAKKKKIKKIFSAQTSGPARFSFFFLLRSPIRVGRVPPFFLTRKPRIPSPPLYKHPSPPISCAPFLLHLQPPPALAPPFSPPGRCLCSLRAATPCMRPVLRRSASCPQAPRQQGTTPPAPAPTCPLPLHAAPPCCCLQRHLRCLPRCAACYVAPPVLCPCAAAVSFFVSLKLRIFASSTRQRTRGVPG